MAAPRAREMTLKTGVSVDTTYGGELLADQATEFVDYLGATTTLFGYVDVQPMKREKQLIERAGFTTRISHRDVPGQESDSSKYADFTRDKYELSAEWFKAITSLDYRTSKINIMGPALGTFLRDDLTRQVSIDQSDNVINGDLLSDDDDLAAFDGIIVQAEKNGNLINPVSPVEFDEDILFALRNALPRGHLTDPRNMIFLMSRKMETAYARYLKQNWQFATGNFITNSQNQNFQDQLEFLGSPCRVDDLMPDDKILFTHRLNIVVGIFLTMFLEMEHKPDAGIDKYIFRYALDTKYKRPEGVALYENITTGIQGTTG